MKFQFIKELFNRSLKCKRLGHKIKTKKFKIRKRSVDGGVCTDFKVKKDICSRCGKYESELYDEKHLRTYTKVSMPTSYWDQIDEKGYVKIDD